MAGLGSKRGREEESSKEERECRCRGYIDNFGYRVMMEIVM